MRWPRLLVDLALLTLLVLLTGALPGSQGSTQMGGLILLALAVAQMALDLTSLLRATGSLASRLTRQVYLRLAVDALMVLSFWPLAIVGVLLATGAGGMMDTLGAHATLAVVAYTVIALHIAQHVAEIVFTRKPVRRPQSSVESHTMTPSRPPDIRLSVK